MTNLFTATGDFFYSVFSVMPALGNAPNAVFIILALVLLTGWTLQLRKHQKEDLIQ